MFIRSWSFARSLRRRVPAPRSFIRWWVLHRVRTRGHRAGPEVLSDHVSRLLAVDVEPEAHPLAPSSRRTGPAPPSWAGRDARRRRRADEEHPAVGDRDGRAPQHVADRGPRERERAGHTEEPYRTASRAQSLGRQPQERLDRFARFESLLDEVGAVGAGGDPGSSVSAIGVSRRGGARAHRSQLGRPPSEFGSAMRPVRWNSTIPNGVSRSVMASSLSGVPATWIVIAS